MGTEAEIAWGAGGPGALLIACPASGAEHGDDDLEGPAENDQNDDGGAPPDG